MQRRCLLKQKAVGTKHLPSSSNCCQLWKRGVDTISKPEVQQGCHFGLSFHFCSPQKPFRLRSTVTLATSPRLIVSRCPNRLSSLHYPAYLSSLTLPVSLLQSHHTVVQPGPVPFSNSPRCCLVRKLFFACTTGTRQESTKSTQKPPNLNIEQILETRNSMHPSKWFAGGMQPQQGGQQAATHCFQCSN